VWTEVLAGTFDFFLLVLSFALCFKVSTPSEKQDSERDTKQAPQPQAAKSTPSKKVVKRQQQIESTEEAIAALPSEREINAHIRSLVKGMEKLKAARYRGHANRHKNKLREIKEGYALLVGGQYTDRPSPIGNKLAHIRHNVLEL
jgi:hypothetical protein